MSKRPGNSAIGTRRWGRIRQGILLRDGYRCMYCGAHATTVDHIIRREHGGNDDPAGLVACCRDCQYPSRRPVPTPVPVTVPPSTRDTTAMLLGGDYGPRGRR